MAVTSSPSGFSASIHLWLRCVKEHMLKWPPRNSTMIASSAGRWQNGMDAINETLDGCSTEATCHQIIKTKNIMDLLGYLYLASTFSEVEGQNVYR